MKMKRGNDECNAKLKILLEYKFGIIEMFEINALANKIYY